MKKGGISVQTENIFPVIKKWLYSDKDIFLRELVSNACDAVTRHKRLVSLSEAEESKADYRVTVTVDKELKTLRVEDNGLGMTEEEVEKYINQIALSGALDFIARYEGEDSKGSGGIIGHFGLGFYSAFMVADRVEIDTKSYTGGSAVHWDCGEDGSYTLDASDREERGTAVTLHVSEEELSYLDYEKAKSVLVKYCGFMPYPVYCREGDREEQVNDTQPIWQRQPSELTEKDYFEFYKKLFNDYRDPLFYVHINADYPLNFKGVLYFPAVGGIYENREGCIKLFYNSVFVADDIKETVPDYLYSLKGVLDCPELPLNVSRSYLQDDAYVKKMSAHIVKKLADKLLKLKNDDFEKYSALWESIKPYIEYGSIKDKKFYDRVKDCLLLKKTDGSHKVLSELLKSESSEKEAEVKENGASDGEEKAKIRIYYTTDAKRQAYYVNLFAAKGLDVYELDAALETQFASFIESKNAGVRFFRVDSSLDDIGGKAEDNATLSELFANASGKPKEKIRFVSLSADDAPVLIHRGEEQRRFSDMMRMYSPMDGEGNESFEDEELSVNTASPYIEKLASMEGEKAELLAKRFYLSAIVASRPLTESEILQYMKNDAKTAELLM